jgi:hypothetical protein
VHKRLVIAIWVACAQAALRVNQPPTDPQPVQNVETVHWFRDEVYPLDSALKAYLRRTFPSVHDFEDLVQESYLRIWKARLLRPIASTRSFLFQVARHAAISGQTLCVRPLQLDCPEIASRKSEYASLQCWKMAATASCPGLTP